MLPEHIWSDVQPFLVVPELADELHALNAEVKQFYKSSAKLHQNSKRIAIVNRTKSLEFRARLESTRMLLWDGMRDLARLAMTCSQLQQYSGLIIYFFQAVREARALMQIIDRNLKSLQAALANPSCPPLVRFLIHLHGNTGGD